MEVLLAKVIGFAAPRELSLEVMMFRMDPARERLAQPEGVSAWALGSAPRGALAALVILAPLLAAGPASAFVPMRGDDCKAGEYARWRGTPTTWYLDAKGYSGIERSEVEAILLVGFEEWSAPCCSGFNSEYKGLTNNPVFGRGLNFVTFFEDSWPAEIGRGDVVLGFNLRGSMRCKIEVAAIYFNAAHHSFVGRDGEPGGHIIDLASVAVHEIGHWLGLDHSEFDRSMSVMTSYTKGSVYERLGSDDVDGVCTIYPASCEPCQASEDCPEGSLCHEGACITSECRSTLDCALGAICRDERCIPGCRFHSECGKGEFCDEGACRKAGDACSHHVDCAAGESCYGGRCKEQPERCSVCEPCTFDSDCGEGSVCFGTPVGPVCTSHCESDRDCPGISECRTFPGAPRALCFNPASTQGICPAGFSCTLTDPGPSLGCSLLGAECTNGSLGCGERADTCYDDVGGPKCSCTCRGDEECGPGGRCLVDPSTDLASCFPGEVLSPCGESFCPPGFSCGEDGCEADLCFGVSCGEGEQCSEGTCAKEGEGGGAPPKKASSSGCSSVGAGQSSALALLAAAALSRGLRRGERLRWAAGGSSSFVRAGLRRSGTARGSLARCSAPWPPRGGDR